MFLKIRLAAIACLALLGTNASAGDYAFRLNNNSSGWTINGFYTFQNGRWSKNWLTSRVSAGRGVNLDWNSDKGDCVVPFRVSWVDYGSEDFRLDWCKGVNNVYMKDNGFSWD